MIVTINDLTKQVCTYMEALREIANKVNEIVNNVPNENEDNSLNVVPDLIIEPKTSDARDLFIEVNADELFDEKSLFEDESNDDIFLEDSKPSNNDYSDNLFTEVVPFSEVSLFTDKAEDEMFTEKKDLIDNMNLPNDFDTNIQVQTASDDSILEEQSEDVEMPELFWETQEDETNVETETNVISFEEGLAKLNLTNYNEPKEDIKVRKLAA